MSLLLLLKSRRLNQISLNCNCCEGCEEIFDTLYTAIGDEIPFTITDYDPTYFEASILGYSSYLRTRDYWASNPTDPELPACLPQDLSHQWKWAATIPAEHIKSGFPTPGVTPYVDLYAYVECLTADPLCENVIFGNVVCALLYESDNNCGDEAFGCTVTCSDGPYEWEVAFPSDFLVFTATE